LNSLEEEIIGIDTVRNVYRRYI
jgi:pre-mRNA-splicing factor SYF1